MPPSLSTAWEPFEIDAKRVGIISDVHIPYHDETAFSAAVKELKKQSPDCLLINGDFADFYQVSRHQRDPHHRRFSEELKLVIGGLEWIRHEFPNARIVFKLGNHEERWDHFIWNRAPEIYDLANVRIDELVKAKQFGIEVIGDQRPIMLGKLPVLHGHAGPLDLQSGQPCTRCVPENASHGPRWSLPPDIRPRGHRYVSLGNIRVEHWLSLRSHA
jgi:predicted phosphodiesterase